jgi:hypothetical protein
MFWKKITIRDQERALVVKNGRFQGIFLPGEYRVFAAPGVSLEIERHNLRDLVFRSRWANYLAQERPEIVEQHFTRVKTSDAEVAMVYVDGELFSVMTPGRSILFWRGAAEVRAEIVEVIAAEAEVPSGMLETLEEMVNVPDM